MKQTAFVQQKNNSIPSRKRGFSLVEVILSVGVLAIAILTLVGLVAASFLQIETIVQTNRAISVCSTVEAALYTPELIGGGGRNIRIESNKPRFNAIYNFLREAVDGKKVSLYYISTTMQNAQTGASSEKTIVYNASDGFLTNAVYKELNGTGPVFRVEISISKQLQQQRIDLDDNGLLTKEVYASGNLPDPAKYALAYVPLNFEIYSHNFSNNTNRSTVQVPIFTQTIIFQR